MSLKRKRPFNRDQPNLKRFRDDVMKLTAGRSDESESGKSKTRQKTKGRKERRKDAKKLKKLRKQAYYQHQPVPTKLSDVEKKTDKNSEEEAKRKKEKKERIKEKKKEVKAKAKMKKKAEKEKVEEIRKRQMMDDIKRDERTLKQLSKQLHMNKRKSKTLPQSFLADGLDYILDAVDEEKVTGLYNKSDSDTESDSEFQDSADEIEAEDFEWLKSKKNKKNEILQGEKKEKEGKDSDDDLDDTDKSDNDDDDIDDGSDDEKEKKQRLKLESEILSSIKQLKAGKSVLKTLKSNKKDSKTVRFKKGDEIGNEEEKDESEDFSNDSDQDVTESDQSDCDDKDNDFVEEEDSNSDDEQTLEKDVSSEDDASNDDENETVEDQPEYKEDIYGRLRDSQGNIVKESKVTGSYIPPGKRLQMAADSDEKNKVKLEKLKKQLKGLINRLSASNMSPISSQIEDLYLSNSRANINETLAQIIMDACISAVMTPERLAMELIMLIAVLHGNVGSEVGAVLAQSLAEKFDYLCSRGGDAGKEIDNVVMLFCYLYNFKVIHVVLIFDLIKKFVASFKQKDLELLILILKNVGFSLRKDDPSGLKEMVQEIQTKANSADKSEFEDKSRVQFMLDTLLAIKNNNMRKIPNYDPELFEQLKKQTRTHLRGSSLGSEQLKISLEDLINAKDKGRWWVVGSAWEGREEDRQLKGSSKTDSVEHRSEGVSEKVLELARQQRMNTDVRRSIFSIIVSSEDFLDAFEKLLRLGLKHQSEREIIHVILHCCQQEKTFNPFYAFLMQKFCEYDRRFQMTFQFSMWDKFKEMSNLTQQNQDNLAQLMCQLLASKAVSLSIFKVVEFGTMDKYMVRYLKSVLRELLLDNPNHVIETVFTRIAPLNKLKHLHEGLKLFMNHFLLRKKSAVTEDFSRLKEAVSLAEKSLSSGQSKMML